MERFQHLFVRIPGKIVQHYSMHQVRIRAFPQSVEIDFRAHPPDINQIILLRPVPKVFVCMPLYLR
jgi:hypothetical protein